MMRIGRSNRFGWRSEAFSGIGPSSMGSWFVSAEDREQRDAAGRFERRGFVARFDDGDAGAVVGEQTRGRARAGDGNADAQPAIRGRAAQLAGNRLRIAEEARQSAEIER